MNRIKWFRYGFLLSCGWVGVLFARPPVCQYCYTLQGVEQCSTDFKTVLMHCKTQALKKPSYQGEAIIGSVRPLSQALSQGCSFAQRALSQYTGCSVKMSKDFFPPVCQICYQDSQGGGCSRDLKVLLRHCRVRAKHAHGGVDLSALISSTLAQPTRQQCIARRFQDIQSLTQGACVVGWSEQ